MAGAHDHFEFILDHYERPRNRGPLARADVVMRGGNPACGDVVTLYLTVDRDAGQIREIGFTGEGCTISQAAASLTTELVAGTSLEHARALRADGALADLGASVLRNRRRCATLALHTLRAALSHYLAEHDGAPVEPTPPGLRFDRADEEG